MTINSIRIVAGIAVEIFILLDVVRSETNAEEMKPQLTLVTLNPVNLNMI